jgi:hypothetical protein
MTTNPIRWDGSPATLDLIQSGNDAPGDVHVNPDSSLSIHTDAQDLFVNLGDFISQSPQGIWSVVTPFALDPIPEGRL